MTKRVAIIQSNYLPWKGYFDIIGMVDEFIIYDEVQYTKNDWRNRNKIKTKNGVNWITLPVYQKKLQQKISETQISDRRWAAKHWNMILTNYSKAMYFREYKEVFETFYLSNRFSSLSEVNVALIVLICQLLNIKTTISNSSSFQLAGNSNERLINLCKQSGANTYLSGPSAKNYLNEDLFTQEEIKVEWMDYSGYPEYLQLYPPFEHGVSIIDLIFNMGRDSTNFMKFRKS